MNDKWMDWAIRIQSLAQAGLAYSSNPFDRERYAELRTIASEIAAARSGLPEETVRNLFCSESGYQTPKIDTRAAIFRDGKILLVREVNGTWSLPGGWCDVDQSVASNIVKEAREEAGLEVVPQRLIAVQDWRRHNVCNYAFGVIKIFVLCRAVSGSFSKNSETTDARFYPLDALPDALACEKNTAGQIRMCFDAHNDEHWTVQFD